MKIFIYIMMLLYFKNVALCLDAKLGMELELFGFHRILKYTTIFDESSDVRCDYCLLQTLPASVYVSTDQLDSLQRIDKISYFTRTIIDVEKLASNASPFDIFLYSHSTKAEIELPIHFRYHLPGNQSFVAVQIDKPKLFLNCLNSEWPSHEKTVKFKCKSGRSLCDWMPIEYEQTTNGIIVSIPIGLKNLRNTVTIVTILVSWMACYQLIQTLIKKSKIIKQKI